MTTVGELVSQIDRLMGRKEQLDNDISDLQTNIKKKERRLRHIELARALIQTVAKQTQEQLRYHITEIVNLALDAVFEDPYEFDVVFEERRGKTECDLIFTKDGEPMDPMASSGGGPLDVASFALRIAIYALSRPRPAPVFILDEPFRFLSLDLQPRASEMLAELARRLGIQMVIVTHSEILAEAADKTFHVSQRRGRSTVLEE